MDSDPSDLHIEEQKGCDGTRRLKPLDDVGRAREILPPDSASTGSSTFHPFATPFQLLLNATLPANTLPSRRNQKLNVVAFISR